MSAKIGTALPVPSQPIKTIEARFSDVPHERPTTVRHFDRNGDGAPDAFMVSDDTFVTATGDSRRARRDFLILLDDRERPSETFVAYDQVVHAHSEFSWQDGRSDGVQVTHIDRNGNGVADQRTEFEVSALEHDSHLRFWESCEIPKSARWVEHCSAKSRQEWDYDEDGTPDRVRPKRP